MKTAVSIPDNLYQKAEVLAERLGTSRSQLYAQALKKFVNHEERTLITEKLNEVYANNSNKLDTAFVVSRMKTLEREEW